MNQLLTNAVTILTRSAPFSGLQASRGPQLLDQINAWEKPLQELSLEQLRKACLALRYRAKSGEPLLRLLPETYALVREAGLRTIGLRHFDVQMLGGIALHFRSITEMQTGEGKTLTATLPLTLAALAGKGAHLATVNDYLARRDAEWMRPIYQCLGLSVGIVESPSSATERRAAYASDITYGTAKEFGFDFLRDRLIHRQADESGTGLVALLTGEAPVELPSVQRGHFFAIVDEADNVLIDDAGTPLIISAVPTQSQQCEADAYLFAATATGHFVEQEHYEYHDDQRTAELTPAGKRLARSLKQPESLRNWSWITLYEYLERAIRVRRDFHKDRHYVVRDGEIVIVDEFTGRLAEGRKWRAGIHQAVEAQEELEITVDAGQSAQITVQDYFRRYEHVAGMTGTAASSSAELRKIYGLKVSVVPTNRPAIRQQLPTAIFADHQAKWAAVVNEVREIHAQDRPVLIGTRSIDQSMHLSRLLTAAAIPHQVLNANEIAAEAEIIARAGEPRSVTVSTNMAGRGTDIRLGAGVDELGGLHVIATEMHEAARIDRQLIGRCGRQGDPGTYRQYLALEDELLKSGLGPRAAERILRRYAGQPGELPASLLRLFHRAQRRVEKRQFRQRKSLLHFEQQRRKIQREMGQDPYLDSLG